MLCDICGKNQATVHLTEIIDDQMTELHLCEACARQKSAAMEQQFGLNELLAGLADFEKPTEDKEAISAKCQNCGLTYADFKKLGRLGCSQCYDAFKKYLGPLLRRIHGSTIHLGKTPQNIPVVKPAEKKTDLQDLRARLQKAIDSEAFEEAANIRDHIRELERQQQVKPREENGGKSK